MFTLSYYTHCCICQFIYIKRGLNKLIFGFNQIIYFQYLISNNFSHNFSFLTLRIVFNTFPSKSCTSTSSKINRIILFFLDRNLSLSKLLKLKLVRVFILRELVFIIVVHAKSFEIRKAPSKASS